MANWETTFVRLIKEIAAEEGIELQSFDDWAFHMKKDGHAAFLYGYQFALDSAATAGVLKDKAATSSMLESAAIPHIPHWCVMNPAEPEFCSLPSSWEFLEEKLKTHGSLVVKDNLGTGGRSVMKVRSMPELEQAAQHIFEKAQSLAVSPYVAIGAEYRAVVLDGVIRLLFRKDRPSLTGDGTHSVRELLLTFMEQANDKTLAGGLSAEMAQQLRQLPGGFSYVPAAGEVITLSWKHNLGQGAVPCVLDPAEASDELKNIVKRTVELFDLHFASVDLVETPEGLAVLEVNGGVMMENIARTSPELYETAKGIYRDAIRRMLS